MSLESVDYKFEHETKCGGVKFLLLVSVHGYSRRYIHNTPKSPTDQSAVELHCGSCTHQVLIRKKTAWNKIDIKLSTVSPTML